MCSCPLTGNWVGTLFSIYCTLKQPVPPNPPATPTYSGHSLCFVHLQVLFPQIQFLRQRPSGYLDKLWNPLWHSFWRPLLIISLHCVPHLYIRENLSQSSICSFSANLFPPHPEQLRDSYCCLPQNMHSFTHSSCDVVVNMVSPSCWTTGSLKMSQP